MVAGVHMTEAPVLITYARVVSRDSMWIAFTIAALHDFELKAADIMNAYLTAANSEKTCTVLGPEFGEDVGKKSLIVRTLYGQKSPSSLFWNHISDCLWHLGYTSCKADANIWMK